MIQPPSLKTMFITLLLSLTLLFYSKTNTYAYDQQPLVWETFNPVEGSKYNTQTVNIAISITDWDSINSVKLYLDDSLVPANVTYLDEYGANWENFEYYPKVHANISYTATKLSFCAHNIKLEAKDTLGNAYAKTQTFYVQALNPQISPSCLSVTCHQLDVHDNHPTLTCSQCHDSAIPTYQAATAYSLSCSGCHTTAHNINLSQYFPNQIPKYPGYTWCTPHEFFYWKGDSWTNSLGNVYDKSMITFTKRRIDVDKDTILTWYKTSLANTGWSISNIANSLTEFKINAEKDQKMKALIWCYSNTNGWSIRILYY